MKASSMSTIETIEQAFERLNLDPTTKPVITGIPAQYVPVLEAVFTSLVVSDALRDGYNPDYDKLERRWEPWFWADNPSGFRFSRSAFTVTYNSERVSPVSLNEDILKQIGREINPNIYRLSEHCIVHYNERIVNIHNKIHMDDISYPLPESLHEMQNLHYILTGEELKLKLI